MTAAVKMSIKIDNQKSLRLVSIVAVSHVVYPRHRHHIQSFHLGFNALDRFELCRLEFQAFETLEQFRLLLFELLDLITFGRQAGGLENMQNAKNHEKRKNPNSPVQVPFPGPDWFFGFCGSKPDHVER